MKRILTIVLCLIAAIGCSAGDVRLSISMAVPQQQEYGKNRDAFLLFRKKLSTAMAASGLGMADYSGLVVCPTITVTNKQVIEGGMRKITVYDIDVSLIVMQAVMGTDFNSTNLSLRGEGYTEEAAFMSAINKLPATDQRLVSFFDATKAKVLDYYRHNADVIIAKARTLAHMQQYEEAMALLYSYPETIMPEYGSVANEMKSIYDQYQRKSCNEFLQQARGQYALGNYDEAVFWLNRIDMLSPCAGEAKAMANNIKNSIDAKERQQMALYQQQLKNEADIRKQRIKTIGDIAVAFLKRSPKYHFIF